jgi:SAM-dependent methyltransferase
MIHEINCLLCHSEHLTVTDSLKGDEIRSLWKEWGNNLSDYALGEIIREFPVEMYRCNNCGFSFFDPKLAGTGEFYEELMAKRKYPTDTPEFNFALSFAKKMELETILDVGGGDGAFLDLARKAGIQTSGIELNRDAAAKAAAKGHRMSTKLLEDIQLDEIGGCTDMLTLFQVVEHVPAPVEFLESAARLVRPGGYIAVAVPSHRRALGLLHLDPADWPPHHVSRWRQTDLHKLAEKASLTVVKTGADPLTGQAIEWAYSLHNRFARTLGHRSLPGAGWPIRAVSTLYRTLRCKLYCGAHGLSIYAIYQKQ